MEKAKWFALRNILQDQLEHIQAVINQVMADRYKTGDEFFYQEIEKWSERETEVRKELSELNQYY